MELTKVYVVQADNYAAYEDCCRWTEGVFAEDMQRIDELEALRDRRRDDGTYDSFEKYGWTMEEFEEYNTRRDYWSKPWRCCPFYRIEEFEVKS